MTDKEKKAKATQKGLETKKIKKEMAKIKPVVVVNNRKYNVIATYHTGYATPALKVCYEVDKTKYWVFVDKIKDNIYYAEHN